MALARLSPQQEWPARHGTCHCCTVPAPLKITRPSQSSPVPGLAPPSQTRPHQPNAECLRPESSHHRPSPIAHRSQSPKPNPFPGKSNRSSRFLGASTKPTLHHSDCPGLSYLPIPFFFLFYFKSIFFPFSIFSLALCRYCRLRVTLLGYTSQPNHPTHQTTSNQTQAHAHPPAPPILLSIPQSARIADSCVCTSHLPFFFCFIF
ncbi:hypothetical protein B0I35DRAFT_121914 [Stachybotrys elegans]|uniref:Uncharacterized protein n=1 Tax=Stachybotrys elegans TaxID=80388 RepID=A0A8K0SYV2_9HYPO|nr:hypothetical protein B0I35DRAFT_121914 [Stachybotrys elegans]